MTDPDSAKMATSKGVIQGYAAQAAVDSQNQVIVAADVTGSGSEQAMLLPMIDKATLREAHTPVTADAGYHSDSNMQAMHERGIPALVADNGMRQRDERIDNAHHKAKGDALHDKAAIKTVKWFRPEDFQFNDDHTATCPAGRTLISNGSTYELNGHRFGRYEARADDCARCHLRTQCLRNPKSARGRQLARFEPKQRDATNPSERMRQAIDSAQGRRLYSQRIATVAGVRQHPAPQAHEPLHVERHGQGRHAVAAVLPGAQHREAGEKREALRALQGRINAH